MQKAHSFIHCLLYSQTAANATLRNIMTDLPYPLNTILRGAKRTVSQRAANETVRIWDGTSISTLPYAMLVRCFSCFLSRHIFPPLYQQEKLKVKTHFARSIQSHLVLYGNVNNTCFQWFYINQ